MSYDGKYIHRQHSKTDSMKSTLLILSLSLISINSYQIKLLVIKCRFEMGCPSYHQQRPLEQAALISPQKKNSRYTPSQMWNPSTYPIWKPFRQACLRSLGLQCLLWVDHGHAENYVPQRVLTMVLKSDRIWLHVRFRR